MKITRNDVILLVIAGVLFFGTPGVPDEGIPIALIILSKLIK